MTLRKTSIALSSAAVAIAAASFADTASAADFGYYKRPGLRYDDAYAFRAPQPNQGARRSTSTL
ncbi:MAG: hypothetical protein WAO08_36135 [Hyphomicrobiaceae bacterium]